MYIIVIKAIDIFLINVQNKQTMNNVFNVLNQFADALVSKSVWGFMSPALPSITVDGKETKLDKNKFGYQLLLSSVNTEGKTVYFPVEIHKDSAAAAANNHVNWKIDVFKATRTYDAVALTNGDIIERDEYATKKANYDLLGVVIDETRSDKGLIHIQEFNPALPVEVQKSSIKLVAIAI